MSQLETYTQIAEERDVLADLQNEVRSPEDAAYLAQVDSELDVAKDALRHRTGQIVMTAEGTIEPKAKMEAMIRDGSYNPGDSGAYRGGSRS